MLSEEMRRMLPPELGAVSERYETHFGEGLRFGAVATLCREARERMAMTTAEVARRLRTAQYRIRAVDSNRFREVDADVLRRYVELLGIRPWFRRWARANRSLMEALTAERD